MNRSIPSIRMGDMQLATESQVLRTLLGSCVGIALYDLRRRVGCLAHVVLPDSRGKVDQPAKFVDTAIPAMIRKMEKVAKGRLELNAKMAGGADMFATGRSAGIGQLNVLACEAILDEHRIPLIARHCGGKQGRRMTFFVETGKAIIELVGTNPMTGDQREEEI